MGTRGSSLNFWENLAQPVLGGGGTSGDHASGTGSGMY